MKPIIRVNHEERKIELNKEYFRRIQNPRSEEYETLQMVRKDYPRYEVCLYKIKRNANKKTYKGLNYEYMETYILTHEPKETKKEVLDEFYNMRQIAECHKASYGYAVIKKWFLKKYPEIAEFGVEKKEDPKAEKVDETKEAAVEVKETEEPMTAEMDAAA
ncbi:MAG: hypothetical protein MR278_03065 [Bacteroidales bacterium]|nr:hypothetical protein [Anaerotignum sp.]MCI5678951.1 hypothetical protein [Bacteroidales bacterium]MDY3927135.1 hypothetical protein [Anaerotignum sp.]